jgi:hypothetical protein
MAATAVNRLTLDPRPCKEIPVFPVSDRPYINSVVITDRERDVEI